MIIAQFLQKTSLFSDLINDKANFERSKLY